MPAVVDSTTQQSPGSQLNFTVTQPSGGQAGDWLGLFIGLNTTGGRVQTIDGQAPADAGWTTLGTQSGSSHTSEAYWRLAEGAGGSPLAIGLNGFLQWTALMVRAAAVDPSDPIGDSSVANGIGATNAASSPLTTTRDGSLVLISSTFRQGTAADPVAGWDTLEVANNGNNSVQGLYARDFPTAGTDTGAVAVPSGTFSTWTVRALELLAVPVEGLELRLRARYPEQRWAALAPGQRWALELPEQRWGAALPES
jgi:hypothetical protein